VAFELFRRAVVDIAVLEVGLGGRLDATNVVTPIATAITSIDFDHQAQLGDSLEAIAREKAGIIKPGVPVVCGPLPAEAEHAIREICLERGARLVHGTELVRLVQREDPAIVDVRTSRRSLDAVTLALHGRHQRDNAAVAVGVLDALDSAGTAVPDEAVRAGLSRAEWPARLELVRTGDTDILLDAAHNPAGARALAAYLRDIGWTDVSLVFGAMHDKDVRSMLAALVPLCARIVCTTAPNPRAIPAEELTAVVVKIAGTRVSVEAIDDPARALAHARRLRGPVVVAGSIFLIGPLRDILR
jgi:dihydrofolate synthase/folylpolyglutamate synthase